MATEIIESIHKEDLNKVILECKASGATTVETKDNADGTTNIIAVYPEIIEDLPKED